MVFVRLVREGDAAIVICGFTRWTCVLRGASISLKKPLTFYRMATKIFFFLNGSVVTSKSNFWINGVFYLLAQLAPPPLITPRWRLECEIQGLPSTCNLLIKKNDIMLKSIPILLDFLIILCKNYKVG